MAGSRLSRSRTLRSLHSRNFRLFIAGHAVSVVGTWMQRVAQDWLVLQLTDSAVAVGVDSSRARAVYDAVRLGA